MASTSVDGTFTVVGGPVSFPANSINASSIKAESAGSRLSADAVEQYEEVRQTFGISSDDPMPGLGDKWVLFIAETAGTLKTSFDCTLANTGSGSGNIEFQLYKNGSSILSASAPVDVPQSTSNYTFVTGTISDTAVAAGDYFEVEITTDSVVEGQRGPYCQIYRKYDTIV